MLTVTDESISMARYLFVCFFISISNNGTNNKICHAIKTCVTAEQFCMNFAVNYVNIRSCYIG